jgi:hypothetical protein
MNTYGMVINRFSEYPIKLFHLCIGYGHCFTSFNNIFYFGTRVIWSFVRKPSCINNLFRVFLYAAWKIDK